MMYLCRLRETTGDSSRLHNVFKAEDSKSVLRRMHVSSVDRMSDIDNNRILALSTSISSFPTHYIYEIIKLNWILMKTTGYYIFKIFHAL
jgi:hypothetical protein